MFLLQAILQIVDGILTYVGVVRFGTTDVEGNPIVKYCMNQLGAGEALILIKTLAILVVLLLSRSDNSNKVIFKRFLIPINLLYTVSAFMWLYILFTKV